MMIPKKTDIDGTIRAYQHAAMSAASICARAFCSGAPGEGLNASSCRTRGAPYRGATVMGFNRKCRAAADMWRSLV